MKEYYEKVAIGHTLNFGGSIMGQNDGTSLSNCLIFNIGGVGAVVLDTAKSFSGASSIKITSNATGGGAEDTEGFDIPLAFAGGGRIRASMKFKPAAANVTNVIYFGFMRIEATVTRYMEVGVRTEAAAQKLIYYNDAGVETELATLTQDIDEETWHHLEIEIDLVQRQYVSVTLNGNRVDMAGTRGQFVAEVDNQPGLWLEVGVYSDNSAAAEFHVDEIFCEGL